jgi:hypothetical protein
MEPYRILTPDARDPLQRALERIELCTYAIQEAHYEVEPPEDPEHKADLLIAVENLAFEAIDLLQTTKLFVWGSSEDDEKEEGDDD